jgi:voltage-gated potassium channel
VPSFSIRRIKYGVAALLGVILAATAGYTALGHSALESLYMVVVTVFGIGYYEVIPTSTAALRVFNIAVIVGGTMAVVYTVSATVQFMTQGEIERMLGARRRMRDIKRLKAHTIVCGYGRMGQILARDLVEAGHAVVVLDEKDAAMQEAEAAHHLALKGDATDEALLIEAGVKEAAHIACVLPNDADNVFISLSARNLNPRILICARGEASTTGDKLRQAGADHVILPPAIGGSRIAQIILSRHNGGDSCAQRLDEVRRGFEALGLVVLETGLDEDVARRAPELRRLGRDLDAPFFVVGIRRRSGDIVVQPDPGETVGPGDRVTLACRPGDRAAFEGLRFS